MNNNFPRFMTYKDALTFFNIGSYSTLYQFIDAGLPVIKIGKSKRIDQTVAEKWLQSKTESNES